MSDTHATLAHALDELRAELQRHGLWSEDAPSPAALASEAPFCHDTLSFHAWLQWVFIPRVQMLIEARAPLPAGCNIAPMAELSYENAAWDSTDLVELLRRIDQLFTASATRWQ